ncbi:restriction endonuclease [bacterium]|nr:restriction endonuclease [bacterium]
MKNRLFYGDCLDVLKNSIDDESIDLIYIDPPFNSKRNYNVLFESIDMSDTKAQKEAFADTWSNVKYIDQLHEIQDLNLDLFKLLSTLDSINVSKGAVSYLTTMALRIIYMHRKLKKAGSFYLHCDPTMGHYLKIICDQIFYTKNFRNEIVWKRMTPSGFKGKRDIGTSHDVIMRYSKSSRFTYNPIHVSYSEEYLKERFNKIDEKGRRFKDEKIGTATSNKTIERLKKEGRIYETSSGKLRIKHFLKDAKGYVLDDVWTDIYAINSQAQERLGYPTQKPEILLERIIQTSSNEGDVVADFFCGCGTAVAVAQRLNRHWIGVDISHLAVRLMYNRLLESNNNNNDQRRKTKNNIEINGFPRDIASARELAAGTKKGRIKFQDWIIEIMLEGVSNPKKVGDGGYDGYLTLYRDAKKRDVVLIEVKSGSITIEKIRAFINVVNHEKAVMGIWVCFADQVTKGMRIEAQQAGYYDQDAFGTKYPRVQILTVEDLFEGKTVAHPYPAMFNVTFKKAYRR